MGMAKNNSGKGKSNDVWEKQTYSEFAIKAEKRNPQTTFSKDLMDRAFSHAVSRTKTVSSAWAQSTRHQSFDRMVSRVSAESIRLKPDPSLMCSGSVLVKNPISIGRIDSPI